MITKENQTALAVLQNNGFVYFHGDMPIDGNPSSHKVMQFLLAACIELKFYSSMLKSIKSIICNESDCGMFQYLLSHDYKTKFTPSFYSKLHGLYI